MLLMRLKKNLCHLRLNHHIPLVTICWIQGFDVGIAGRRRDERNGFIVQLTRVSFFETFETTGYNNTRIQYCSSNFKIYHYFVYNSLNSANVEKDNAHINVIQLQLAAAEVDWTKALCAGAALKLDSELSSSV
mmetsp:Transcript_15156/g.37383  ORF Transcript_15156/g.37383 Transcript_15156/m.37383 type:complete len:133 (-) Transcript_15156:63-461(-)